VGVVILLALIAVARVSRSAEQGPIRSLDGSAVPSPAPDASSVLPPPNRGVSLRLRGIPLQSPTDLRLLVADLPPFVLDLDRGTAQPITGLSAGGDRGVTVLPASDHALVLSYRFCNSCRTGVYLLPRGSTHATRLATALEAVASRDGEDIWMLNRRDARHCTVREVGVDNRLRRTARRVSCRTDLVAEVPSGLFVSNTGPGGRDEHNALLKEGGGVVRLPYQRAQPVVGDLLLTGVDRRTPLLLHDVRGGAPHRLRWPSGRGYSFGEVTGDPRGGLAIVEFAKFSPEHRLDMWLLDTTTRRWQHLPGMPAHLVPKATDVQWTADGRVVVLSGDVLGVWRPGASRFSVRQVKASKQPGSEFVAW
jgi:hypothetical protein